MGDVACCENVCRTNRSGAFVTQEKFYTNILLFLFYSDYINVHIQQNAYL